MGTGAQNNTACTVGYTMVGLHQRNGSNAPAASGVEYRYTEWVGWNTPSHPNRPDWGDNYGVELYAHANTTYELVNLATDPAFKGVVAAFSARLQAGPSRGGGWGGPPPR